MGVVWLKSVRPHNWRLCICGALCARLEPQPSLGKCLCGQGVVHGHSGQGRNAQRLERTAFYSPRSVYTDPFFASLFLPPSPSFLISQVPHLTSSTSTIVSAPISGLCNSAFLRFQ